MDTPITISSTLSSIGKSQKKITQPHSESSIARVPVSWDSPLKPCERELSCTPSTLQKVNNWINSLSRLSSRDNVDSNNCSLRQSSDFSDVDTPSGLNFEGNLVHGPINMSDYNRSDQKPEDEFDNYRTSPYDFENAERSQSTSDMYGGGPKHFYQKAIKRRKSYNTEDKDEEKSDDYDSDEPLSPESEKKKELCSYLQLMKPADKKTVMILQNRRSVRVKNLSIMQEKKELEKKLRETNNENNMNINDTADNNLVGVQTYPGLKSLDEMNVNLDKKKYKWLKYSGPRTSNESFCFPRPANILRDFVNDFDDVKVFWLETSKEDANKQQNILKNQLKEKKKPIKKNGNDSSQNNGHTDEIAVNESQMPEQIQFENKKIEVPINKNVTAPTNGEVKRNAEIKYNKAHKDHKVKTKIIHSENKRKRQDPEGNNFKKVKSEALNSRQNLQFMIPKPSVLLVHDVNDFDVIIKQNRDIIEQKSLPRSPAVEVGNIKNKRKVFSSEVTAMSKNKSIGSSETIAVPASPAKLEHGNGSDLLDLCKSKVQSIKKKPKYKKPNTERNVRKSSFKIKLKPKRKSLGSLGKSEKKLTRSKSPLIADIMKSLRNRNIETPTFELNLLKNNKAKKDSFRNKKENIKRKVKKLKNCESNIASKLLKNAMEVPIKEPLKDTNKNPVKSTNLSNNMPVIKEISPKVISENSKLPVNENISPKVHILQNIMLDVDFCNLSTEHKKSLLVDNINQHDISMDAPIIAIYYKNDSQGSESSSRDKVKEKAEFYSQILNIEKYPKKDLVNKRRAVTTVRQTNANDESRTSSLESRRETDSDLHSSTSTNKGYSTPVSSKNKSDTNSDKTHRKSKEATPFILFKKDVGITSLHKCLNVLSQKSVNANLEVDNSPTSWSLESPNHKRKKNEHSINTSREHGSVLKAFYLEYNLVLCQEFMVSFWTQTALGNVLGAQNMWIHKGSVQRMAMNNNCIFKESLEMVVSTDGTVAYIELWTKEHQSDIREGPVADVFATVYFWRKGQNGLDKKVLQLENINGFADDVQYSVFKSTPKIIVSWHLACNELESKKTFIHCYQLAADYQTVYNISEFEAVEHYVSSLHNIEGCDSLIMGCGENKITLWNIDYGYVVATVEMSEIRSPLSTLWVKCDRGFLFTLQQCVNRELRLIAIHGMNHSWKKLASYVPPKEYDRLKGVCVENGIVLAFYDQGVICWNAQTAETVLEELHSEAEYISGKYVISVVNDQVNIRHAITHLLSAEDL